MTLRSRLAAVAMAAALAAPALALAAGPAPAATDPCTGIQKLGLDVTLTIWQPGPQTSAGDAHQCTPKAGTTLTGTWNVRIDAFAVGSLKSFTVSVAPADTSIPGLTDAATTSRTYPTTLLQTKTSDTIQLSWDTSSLTPYNGLYQVSATATSLLGDGTSAVVGSLTIANPPRQPSAPGALVDATTPVLLWTPNPEPDITGYQVLRASAGGGYSVVGTTADHSYEDTKAPMNAPLTYEVVAVRRSPSDPNGITSAPSAASPPVTVSPPSATISTTASAPPPKVIFNPAPRVAARGPDPGATFAPTLPFNQPIPTDTATEPNQALPLPTVGITLPGGGGGPTTLVEKLRYFAAAIVIAIVAILIFRYSRRLRRGER